MNYIGIDFGARNIFMSLRTKIKNEGGVSDRFVHKMIQNAYDKACSLYNHQFLIVLGIILTSKTTLSHLELKLVIM